MHVFLDLDDTLIQTQPSYVLVGNEVAHYIQKNYIDIEREEIINRMDKINLEGVLKGGVTIERYPTAWVLTLESFANEYRFDVSENDKQTVYKMAQRIFEMCFPLHDHVIETIEWLKGKEGVTSVEILTLGDYGVQMKRIYDANIHHLMDNIHIVSEKNENVYKTLKNDRSKPCVMIGNSLRSDIVPALAAKWEVIHIERETWAYDMVNEEVNVKSVKCFSHIKDILPEILYKKVAIGE